MQYPLLYIIHNDISEGQMSVLLRVLELKAEMVSVEMLEYHYFDDILSDMKLTPVSSPLSPTDLCVCVAVTTMRLCVHAG